MNVTAKISRDPTEVHSPEEHARWGTLYRQQMKALEGRLCPEFENGLKALSITDQRIPDFDELNAVLTQATGWTIFPVSQTVNGEDEFDYLASRRFPAYAMIRSADEMKFAKKPDIFHDLFGHVPMLMNPMFADIVEIFGKAGVKASEQGDPQPLLNLYFATSETGLIQTPTGFAIYGAACASSKGEAINCMKDGINRVRLNVKDAMARPVDDSKLQERYYAVSSFQDLHRLLVRNLDI